MKKTSSGLDPVVWGIIGITVIVFTGVVISSVVSKGTPVESYEITDKERPILEISGKDFDFGRMKSSEVKAEEIEIKNIGNKPLIVSDVITSCDCTFAQFIIADKESKKFSMQRDLQWRGEIPADTSAVLKIIYEPRIMPVKGKVSRSVFFKTNDPKNPSVTINFSAFVE